MQSSVVISIPITFNTIGFYLYKYKILLGDIKPMWTKYN